METHADYARESLSRIDGKIDQLLAQTSILPSKTDLNSFRWQWVATAVAAIALIVGGIIGGLGWIKPDAATPSPIVVQTPAPVAAPSAPIVSPRRP